VVPDPTFDCSDLIGKVFDDKNANGYEDQGERGIPNVRLATVNGLLITTDAEGRFHVACAAVPLEFRGSNFLMKLDERTLPSGYRVTTENPRDVRLTRGKLSKLNFGAAIHRVFRIDLTDAAFKAGTDEPSAELAKSIADLPEQLRAKPSVVRFAYALSKDDETLAKNRMKALRKMIEKNWKDKNCCYALMFEEEIFQPLATQKGGAK
jgi:large repetitive protein